MELVAITLQLGIMDRNKIRHFLKISHAALNIPGNIGNKR
jgi:hypothetical protein